MGKKKVVVVSHCNSFVIVWCADIFHRSITRTVTFCVYDILMCSPLNLQEHMEQKKQEHVRNEVMLRFLCAVENTISKLNKEIRTIKKEVKQCKK